MAKQYEGELFDWFETGCEGVIWSLQESKHISKEGYYSYDGLKPIKRGDYLKAYDKDKLVWEGEIDPDFSVKVAGPFNVHWVQRGVEPIEWLKLFCKLKSRDY